ncbi:hypothetical protein LEADMM068B1_07035 [Leclercia adecarboxylata]
MLANIIDQIIHNTTHEDTDNKRKKGFGNPKPDSIIG